MRFIFVDRIVGIEPGHRIEILKNVSATEDVFADHFPGCPIFPGALIVEVFEQAAQLLIGIGHDFQRVGRLRTVQRASFRHLVRPGDQLRARCELSGAPQRGCRVTATAAVEERRVASASLEFSVEAAIGSADLWEEAERLRALAAMLLAEPLALAGLTG